MLTTHSTINSALSIFEENLGEIRQSLLDNASEIIAEHTPYKELGIEPEDEWTEEAIVLGVEHLYIEQHARPLLKTVQRIDSYRYYTDRPQIAGDAITDMDIQNAKEVDADWFIQEAQLSTRKPHKGTCPFHNDSDPSLTLMRSKQTGNHYLKCFPCGECWDSIGYIRKRDGASFINAVKYIIRK